MKNVLVVGAFGFIGKNLVKYLRENTNWEIEECIYEISRGLPIQGRYDYIINLASMSSVEYSNSHPAEVIKNNVNIAVELAEYARKYPPEALLHLSTIEVNANANPYAASKLAQEKILTAYRRTYGINTIIARSTNVIGPGQSADKFVPKLIDKINKGEEVEIYTSDGIVGRRVYNTVLNVCDAIMWLLVNNKDKKIVEVDGGFTMDNLEMANKIASKLGKKLDYKLVNPVEARPNYSLGIFYNDAKLTSLGWKPPHTKLEQAFAWIQ